MQSAIEELHRSLYGALTSHQPLMDKITAVKDGVDETDGFPYVTIGEPVINPHDTKNTTGENITMVLHVWSDYPGKLQAYQIMNLVYEALAKPLSINGGFHAFHAQRETQNVFTDIDGRKRHGVMNFRFYINN